MVKKVLDLVETKQLIDDQGISTTIIRQKWKGWVFYCFDPEGNHIELWADYGRQEEQSE